MPLDVVAIVSPAPGKENRVEEILRGLTSDVEKHEPDVQRYHAFKQKGVSGIPECVVIERYKDEAAYDAHFKTEYFGEVGKMIQTENLLARPLNIMKLEVVGGFESR